MLSRLIRKTELILISFLILISCSESKKPDSYIAKVNDSYLTESELAEMIDSLSFSEINRTIIVKNWVRQELLYQEAVKEGLTDSRQFKLNIEESKKQLASALILEKIASESHYQFTDEELQNFFDENQSSFKLPFNSYNLNRIDFKDRDAAVIFRTEFIANGWDEAVNVSKQDTNIVNVDTSILLSEQDIQPLRLLRILEGLYPLEISIVIPDERGYYSVVQLIEKYSAGSVPSFQVVKNEVERRYRSTLIELTLENYIDELYSLNEIEIK